MHSKGGRGRGSPSGCLLEERASERGADSAALACRRSSERTTLIADAGVEGLCSVSAMMSGLDCCLRRWRPPARLAATPASVLTTGQNENRLSVAFSGEWNS
jgi:hypothetical protein